MNPKPPRWNEGDLAEVRAFLNHRRIEFTQVTVNVFDPGYEPMPVDVQDFVVLHEPVVYDRPLMLTTELAGDLVLLRTYPYARTGVPVVILARNLNLDIHPELRKESFRFALSEIVSDVELSFEMQVFDDSTQFISDTEMSRYARAFAAVSLKQVLENHAKLGTVYTREQRTFH